MFKLRKDQHRFIGLFQPEFKTMNEVAKTINAGLEPGAGLAQRLKSEKLIGQLEFIDLFDKMAMMGAKNRVFDFDTLIGQARTGVLADAINFLLENGEEAVVKSIEDIDKIRPALLKLVKDLQFDPDYCVKVMVRFIRKIGVRENGRYKPTYIGTTAFKYFAEHTGKMFDLLRDNKNMAAMEHYAEYMVMGGLKGVMLSSLFEGISNQGKEMVDEAVNFNLDNILGKSKKE